MLFTGKMFFVLCGFIFGVNEYSCFSWYIFGAKQQQEKLQTFTAVEIDP